MQIHDFEGLISFGIWTFVVLGVASALFSSFLSQEATYRINTAYAAQDEIARDKMRRLAWEIKNRAVYDADVERNVPHAVRQELSPEAVLLKRHELNEMARFSIGRRALTFFLGCVKCQTTWAAVALLVIYAPDGTTFANFLATVFAYSTASTLLYTYWRKLDPVMQQAQPSCSCGKKK